VPYDQEKVQKPRPTLSPHVSLPPLPRHDDSKEHECVSPLIVHLRHSTYHLKMPPQIKQDLNRSGWETTDFPSVCENCLPENNYVQMLKSDHDAVSTSISKSRSLSCPLSRFYDRALLILLFYRNAKFAQDPSQSSAGKPTAQLAKSAQTFASPAHASRTAANAACSISPSGFR
jgi:hypothetical protein